MDNEFSKLFEQYMLLDKKTLAELLALKELKERNGENQPQPYVLPPYVPSYPYPSYPYPWDVPQPTAWPPQVWYTTSATNGKEYEHLCHKDGKTWDGDKFQNFS